MKIANQISTIWGECPSDRKSGVKWIERAGRICYRSEDKIVEGSDEVFVSNILKRNHKAVIEASNLVIRSKDKYRYPVIESDEMKKQYASNYLNHAIEKDRIFVGGNWRAWMEKLDIHSVDNLFSFFENHNTYEIVPKNEIPFSLKRVTVEMITDRAVTHEIVRHRPCSFLQESQRYCSYMDNLEFISQWWWRDLTHKQYINIVEKPLIDAEFAYKGAMFQLKDHSQIKRAEKARFILPNATSTKIAVTADLPEWNLIFSLRCSSAAYPQMRNMMNPLKQGFSDYGWLTE